MPALIVLGDKTDHGGQVIEASGVTDTHGKGIARVGDMVTCPKKGHGTNQIVTGDNTMLIDGKAAAYHGCKTACGATLLSSQFVSTIDFGSAVGSKTSTSTSPKVLLTAIDIATSRAPVAPPKILPYDEQIVAIDSTEHLYRAWPIASRRAPVRPILASPMALGRCPESSLRVKRH